MDKILRVAYKQLAPISDNKHLITKEYLDARLAGGVWDPVVAASTGDLALTSVDAVTLTAAASGELADIDGAALAANDRILLKDQTDKSQNGIYVLTDAGSLSTPCVLTRAADADQTDEFKSGKTVYVINGALNGDGTFRQTTSGAINIGSDAIEFVRHVPEVYVQSETAAIHGDGVANRFDIAHTLNTRNVKAALRNLATGDLEEFGVHVAGKALVQVYCEPPLQVGEDYDVTLFGEPDSA